MHNTQWPAFEYVRKVAIVAVVTERAKIDETPATARQSLTAYLENKTQVGQTVL